MVLSFSLTKLEGIWRYYEAFLFYLDFCPQFCNYQTVILLEIANFYIESPSKVRQNYQIRSNDIVRTFSLTKNGLSIFCFGIVCLILTNLLYNVAGNEIVRILSNCQLFTFKTSVCKLWNQLNGTDFWHVWFWDLGFLHWILLDFISKKSPNLQRPKVWLKTQIVRFLWQNIQGWREYIFLFPSTL